MQIWPLRIMEAFDQYVKDSTIRNGAQDVTMQTPNPSRRVFLKASLTAVGSLVIAGMAPSARIGVARAKERIEPRTLATFIELHPNGSVSVWVPVPEVGQGVHTSHAMLVAEELEVPWSQVRVKQAPADARYGPMAVSGSDSIRDYWQILREAGATARELLIRTAASEWSVAADTCDAEMGFIVHPASGKRFAYGDLLPLVVESDVDYPPRLKEPDEFTVIGRELSGVHLSEMISGRSSYGMDVVLPGMRYAVIARCPVYGGKVKQFDPSKALAIPGVETVLEVKPLRVRNFAYGEVNSGVAVIANSTWTAIRGRQQLDIIWDEGPNRLESSTAIRARFLEALDSESSHPVRNERPERGLTRPVADELILDYELPALSQAPMEPMNFTVDVRPDKCEAHGPVQVPRNLQVLLASFLELPVDAVELHPTLIGGGFGRRLAVDYGIEAAYLSKETGTPVQVVWTREDDMGNGFYRSPSAHRVVVGFDKQNKPLSWRHRIVTDPIAGVGAEKPAIYEVAGAADHPYAFEQIIVDYVPVKTGFRPGSWRSVSHSFNNFVVNSAIDEIAVHTGLDPFNIHQKLLRPGTKTIKLPFDGRRGNIVCEVDRLKHVLDICAQQAGWRKPKRMGRGRGIACCHYKTTYVAHMAEVEANQDGDLRVVRVVAAIDCGLVVNPDGVRAQVEGAVMDGIATVFGMKITMERGRIEQSNFNTYHLSRMADAPEIDVHIVASDKLPGGAGEPPYPSVAPAITNAIYDATGRRIRSLPIQQQMYS